MIPTKKPRKFAIAVLSCGALAALSGCATPRPASLANAGEASLQRCQQVTGSRIRSSTREDCEPLGHPFRSYSAEELQSTGEIDLAEALRQLDPAFR